MNISVKSAALSMAGLLLIASQLSAQTEWNKTLAAAKAEGKVVVVGPTVASHRDAVMKFQEAFPEISLEFTGLVPATLMARLTREREAGQYVLDVLVSGVGTTQYSHMTPGGWYIPIKSAVALADVRDDAKWLGGFDAGFADRSKTYSYGFALYLANTILVNRDIIPRSALQKAEDLLDPKWKGRSAWWDPRGRGPGGSVLVVLRKLLGDPGLKRLLVDQEPAITEDGRQLAEWLVRGRYPISFGLGASDLSRFQKEGLGLNVERLALPLEPVTPGWGGVMLMNPSPHPNAAKIFLNWLLGQKAQASWAQLGGVNSRRLDIPPGDPDTVLDPKRLNSYENLSAEENAEVRADAAKLAKMLLK